MIGQSVRSVVEHKLLRTQAQQMINGESDIIRQLCEIYSVENENELIQCAQKTELVMQAIPKMETLLSQISDIIFANQQTNNFNLSKREHNIDQIIPLLQKWAFEIKLIDQFVQFKDCLCETLSIPLDSSTDKDILNSIQSIKSQLQTANSLNNNNNNNQKAQELMRLFEIGEDDNVQAKVSQIFQQLNAIQRFVKITKQFLDLDDETHPEVCLSYILKLLEKMKMNSFNDPDLILKIMKSLKIDNPVEIIPKIESITKKCKINSQNSREINKN